MTDAQRQIQPGRDKVKTRHSGEFEWLVVFTTEFGVFVTRPAEVSNAYFIKWADVVLPKPQKAKPGVIYRMKTHTHLKSCGLASGMLSHRSHESSFPLTDEWEEDPVQP